MAKLRTFMYVAEEPETGALITLETNPEPVCNVEFGVQRPDDPEIEMFHFPPIFAAVAVLMWANRVIGLFGSNDGLYLATAAETEIMRNGIRSPRSTRRKWMV